MSQGCGCSSVRMESYVPLWVCLVLCPLERFLERQENKQHGLDIDILDIEGR